MHRGQVARVDDEGDLVRDEPLYYRVTGTVTQHYVDDHNVWPTHFQPIDCLGAVATTATSKPTSRSPYSRSIDIKGSTATTICQRRPACSNRFPPHTAFLIQNTPS